MILECKQCKKEYKLRSDGYYSYSSSKNHRNIIEDFTGKKLLSKQSVHHIDGNKINNNIDNLFVCDSSNHLKIHNSLEKCAFELVKLGIITFEDGKYTLSNKIITNC
jgi:hypothetical protein